MLEIIKTFISILAVINPAGAIPIFLSLTADRPLPERNRTAKTAALSVAIALLVTF